MIQSHLSLVIGVRFMGSLNSVVQISKLKLGKLYAASITYGYFLERVDERFQLERSMNTFPPRIDDSGVLNPNHLWDMESMVQISPDDDGFSSEEGNKSYRLRSYVMYLDADILQIYVTIRSKEAVLLREADTGMINDEVVNIRLLGLTMLVLEAVTFGSFLWELESQNQTITLCLAE